MSPLMADYLLRTRELLKKRNNSSDIFLFLYRRYNYYYYYHYYYYSAEGLREVFGRMGFNDQEIVALSGAHALGR